MGAPELVVVPGVDEPTQSQNTAGSVTGRGQHPETPQSLILSSPEKPWTRAVAGRRIGSSFGVADKDGGR